MNLIVDNTNVKLEFQKRYYYWALSDWDSEIQESFISLSRIKNPVVEAVLIAMDNIETYQRYYLASGLVGRFRKELLLHINKDFTKEEARLVDYYMDTVQHISIESTLLRNFNQYKKQTLNKKLFKQTLIDKLAPVLGMNYQKLSRYEWKYSLNIGSWHVDTYIDIGGRYHQLVYDHVIKGPGNFILMDCISILSWLGISSQTSWRGLGNDDICSVVDSLSQIIYRFMVSAPILLKDLDINPTH